MGRQIAVITTPADELELLQMMAEQSALRIFRRIADSFEQLWIHDWQSAPNQESEYYIWPTQFRWTPSYYQIGPPCVPEVEGNWVIANDGVAPALQFSRHVLVPNSPGRLYWSKYFSATEPLNYDVDAFDKFVDRVWRWVRKNGKRLQPGTHEPYVLPNALRQRGEPPPNQPFNPTP